MIYNANYGILTSERCHKLFTKINKRYLCDKCKSNRSDFSSKDQKGTSFYSNLLLGFSSTKITASVDVLIVGEAHGGGRKEDFRKEQKDLWFEIDQIAKYYRKLPDKTFHQQQIRILLENLDNSGVTWVFTDLIKCFVWHGFDKGYNLDGSFNWKTAIRYCSKYLEEQIEVLQPQKILGLGGTVARYFNLDKPEHGRDYAMKNRNCTYIHSLFPSRWTADQWAVKKGWESITPKLVS